MTVFDGAEFTRRCPMNNLFGPLISPDCERVAYLGSDSSGGRAPLDRMFLGAMASRSTWEMLTDSSHFPVALHL